MFVGSNDVFSIKLKNTVDISTNIGICQKCHRIAQYYKYIILIYTFF